MEFDGDVVNFNINDDDISDNVSVNFSGTDSPLPEDCCEFF